MTASPAARDAGEGWAGAVDPRLVSRLLGRRPRAALPVRRAVGRMELAGRLLPVPVRLGRRSALTGDDGADPLPPPVPAMAVQAAPTVAATAPARARPAAPPDVQPPVPRPPVWARREPAPAQPGAGSRPGVRAVPGAPTRAARRRPDGPVPVVRPSTGGAAQRPVLPVRRPVIAQPDSVPAAVPVPAPPAVPARAASPGPDAPAAERPEVPAPDEPLRQRNPRRPLVRSLRTAPDGALPPRRAGGPPPDHAGPGTGTSGEPAVRQLPPARTRTGPVPARGTAAAVPGRAAAGRPPEAPEAGAPTRGAPTGGVIQRLSAGSATPAEGDGPSTDELVERVLRRLGREVAVAAERRGLRSGERPGELGR